MSAAPDQAKRPPTPGLPPLALLIAVTALAPFGFHVLIPSVPSLVGSFAAEYGTVQLTLTLYLIGQAISQLGYGPLSDRFGRRPVMLWGFVIFLAATALCAVAWSIEMLVIARVFQAIGGCAGLVLVRAIIRDVYDRDRGASMIAVVTMMMAIVQGAAPVLGAYVDAWAGWRAIFVGMAAIGVVLLVATYLRLSETNRTPLPVLDLRGIIGHYGELMRSMAFMGYALSTSLITAVYYVFLAGAPYVLVEIMHRPIEEYGRYFALMVAGYMLGNFLTSRFTVRIGGDRMMNLGLLVSIAATLAMLALSIGEPPHPLALFGPMVFYVLGNGLSQPNGISAAVGIRPQIAGSASGLLGFFQLAVSAGLTWLLGFVLGPSVLPMIWIMVLGIVLALVFALLAQRRR